MFYDKLDLYYSPVSKRQEAYICVLLNNSGVNYSKEVVSRTSYTIRISVLIPKELSFTARMLSMNEEEMVTKNVIMDALSFWKELAYIVLVGNKNTQATRNKQSGYYLFYLIVVYFHYLVLKVSSFTL